MNFLKLEPLTHDLLPAVVELDRRCLGGLWSIEGYRREIESPNSDLLVLQREAIDEISAAAESRPAFAPQPSNSGELPNHEHLENLPLFQSPPSLSQSSKLQRGDLGGDAALPVPTQPFSPTGLGCLWAIAEEAHITVLAIDPNYRNQGLGQAILYALLVSAHHRGLEWATLEVRASNAAAIRLYEKFGFREVGRRKGYYSDGEDALILWRSGLQKPEFRLWIQDGDRQIQERLRRSGYEISLKPALQTAFT